MKSNRTILISDLHAQNIAKELFDKMAVLIWNKLPGHHPKKLIDKLENALSEVLNLEKIRKMNGHQRSAFLNSLAKNLYCASFDLPFNQENFPTDLIRSKMKNYRYIFPPFFFDNAALTRCIFFTCASMHRALLQKHYAEKHPYASIHGLFDESNLRELITSYTGKDDALPMHLDPLLFIDFEDNEIENPAKKIDALNKWQRKYERIQAPTQPINYTGTNRITGAAFAERWGNRPTQEDQIRTGKLPTEFRLLTAENRNLVFKNVVKILAEENADAKCGSTLCFSVVDQHKIFVVNVGDSRTILVNCANETILESETHSTHLYLKNRRLAMSRALGDAAWHAAKLTAKPDIYEYDTQLVSHVITACDGLTDGLSLNQILQIVREAHKKRFSNQHIARSLVDAAYTSGSNDNISAIVNTVDPTSEFPTYNLVCDGHGGSNVAEKIARRFHEVLVAEIKKQYRLQLIHTEHFDNKKNIILLGNKNFLSKPVLPKFLKKLYEIKNLDEFQKKVAKALTKPAIQLNSLYKKFLNAALTMSQLETDNHTATTILAEWHLQHNNPESPMPTRQLCRCF
jgi:serine/threonine protein phosphatase PrpC